MSSQSRITSIDDAIFHAGLICCALNIVYDLTVSLYGFFFCETTGIGQYKEKLVFLCKAFSHALYTPVRINGHIVYCLHACGVIVKNYDL